MKLAIVGAVNYKDLVLEASKFEDVDTVVSDGCLLVDQYARYNGLKLNRHTPNYNDGVAAVPINTKAIVDDSDCMLAFSSKDKNIWLAIRLAQIAKKPVSIIRC